MSMDKRRLKLLPEVLPDPTAARGPGSPRQRTLEHMKRLLTVSAAMSAAVGCSKEDQVAVRPEDPSKMKKVNKAEPEPTTTTTTTASGTSTVPTTTPTPSYAVVDPLPPPACSGLASTITASATWKTAGGATFIELKLAKPGRADGKYEKVTTTNVYGGKLLSYVEAGNSVTAQVVPDASSKSVYVYVPIACSTGKERIYASIAFPSAGGALSVVLTDLF
jgi:hypothetical protein